MTEFKDYATLMREAEEQWEKDRKKTFEILKSRGIKTVTIEFSGGNDEGNVEHPILLDKSGADIGFKAYEDAEIVWEVHATDDGKYISKNLFKGVEEEATEDQYLYGVLSQPIYKEYGTFAGEFSCEGTLTWDVDEKKISMDHRTTIETWEDHESEF